MAKKKNSGMRKLRKLAAVKAHNEAYAKRQDEYLLSPNTEYPGTAGPSGSSNLAVHQSDSIPAGSPSTYITQ